MTAKPVQNLGRAELAAAAPSVSASEVEAAVAAAAAATNLPKAEIIGKQPMTIINNDQYWCNVCQSGMTSEDILEMHIVGKKHKAKLIRVDASLFLPHTPLGPLTGRKGKKRSASVAGLAGTAPAANELFRCEICECGFPNEVPYNAHMAGKKHAKRMKAPAINANNSQYSCAVCQFVGNSPAHLEAHLSGKAHAKKAGLPTPPPGPAATPPKPDSQRKKPSRYNPYFKPNPSSNGSDAGAYHQPYQSQQVRPVTATPSSNGSGAAYTTGISGSYGQTGYGYNMYDK